MRPPYGARMDLGVCIASSIGDVDHAVLAEQLGYTHAWFADSQMLWSDCYATKTTRTIPVVVLERR